MKLRILPLTVLFLLCFGLQAYAQWSSRSLTHDGKTREYMFYLPDGYDESNPASLVFTLHGLGGNMQDFSQLGFDRVADTTNYIVVVPQALSDILAGTAWNSRAGILGYYPNNNVDDKGFLNALVDVMSASYSINPDQVYMCGYSMGGFMSQRMACESNEKFAAFASVAGTLGSGINGCNPGRSIPIAHFHGTEDDVVGYYSNTFGINVEDLKDIWVANNNANPVPIHTALPDLAPDAMTVDHFLYTEGNEDFELFRVNGAEHMWLHRPQNDIAYTEEIIKFFNKTHEPLSVEDHSLAYDIKVYPNPAKEMLHIELPNGNSSSYQIGLYDMLGKLIYQKQASEAKTSIALNNLSLSHGVYVLRLNSSEFSLSQKVIVE